jgi:hypothetical protein
MREIECYSRDFLGISSRQIKARYAHNANPAGSSPFFSRRFEPVYLILSPIFQHPVQQFIIPVFVPSNGLFKSIL